MITIFEPIERIIPSLFDAYYVKKVLPNTKINGIPTYNFATGIDSDKVIDIIISFVEFFAEMEELAQEEVGEIQTAIKENRTIIKGVIDEIIKGMDFRTYICQETRFTIKDIGTANIDLSELMMILKEIVPEEEMTPEEIVEFERAIEAVKNINIIATWNFRYKDHNAVPAIVPPAEYEELEPVFPF
jgi:hypothetical protein